MDIITADWETYYDKEYSLSKLTTEEYVRSPLFEAIMLGLRWPDGTYELIKGTHGEIQHRLDSIEWEKFAILCHNTMFDAAIFTWRFGVKPRAWLDTLSMARAMHGVKGNSLAALAKRYNLDEKGTAVLNMLGKRRKDMTDQEFKDYAVYCLDDVKLCYELWSLMSAGWYDLESCDFRGAYPLEELRLIDQHIRMYTEPVLHLNKDKLKSHLQDVVDRKAALLDSGGIAKDELMSNPKFAAVLESFGVSPPMKISPTTKKLTYAFAKTDPGIKALLEHPDFRVQAAVSARLGVKSTLEETRTQRFINISTRGPTLPVPLRYSYARTKRSSGCLVAETQVLVYDPVRGPTQKKIVDVLADDLVWDGEAFVAHEGVQFSGYRDVIHWDGVIGTSDHVVFTESGEISLLEAMQRGSRIQTAGDPTQHELDAARLLASRIRE